MRSRSGSAHSRALRAVSIGAAIVLICAIPADASSGWVIVASPSAGSTSQSFLDGVSCTSTGGASCIAVGSALTTKGVLRTLVEHWNGSKWVVAASPNHPHALVSALVAVSCTGPSNCFAVGNYRATPTSNALTLIERWNGRKWSIGPSPNMKSATGNYLTGVSCARPTSCIAVGYGVTPFSTSSTFVERWNGAKWAVMASPNPPGAAASSLTGVSCSAPKAGVSCNAVGSYATRPDGAPFYTLAEHWAGKKWKVVASPNAHGNSNSALNAVSCASAKSCLAVGLWQHKPGAPLVEKWNGSSWKIAPSPNPRGFTIAQLNGVSCSGSGDCYGVGTFSTDLLGNNRTLIAHWNGSTWLLPAGPNPARASSGLASISCVAKSCVAVGSYLRGSFAGPLTVRHG